MKKTIAFASVFVLAILVLFSGCSFDREYKDDIVIELTDREGVLIIREWSFLMGSGAEVYYDYGWRSIRLGQTSGADDGYCPFEAGQYRVVQKDDAVELSWRFNDAGVWRSASFDLPEEAALKRQGVMIIAAIAVAVAALGAGAFVLVRHIRRRKARQS